MFFKPLNFFTDASATDECMRRPGPAGGKDRGERVLGIYKLEGDRLTICRAAPGKPRPSEFKAEKGSGCPYHPTIYIFQKKWPLPLALFSILFRDRVAFSPRGRLDPPCDADRSPLRIRRLGRRSECVVDMSCSSSPDCPDAPARVGAVLPAGAAGSSRVRAAHAWTTFDA